MARAHRAARKVILKERKLVINSLKERFRKSKLMELMERLFGKVSGEAGGGVYASCHKTKRLKLTK